MVNVEHWTSATDEGSGGNFMWCSNKTFLNMKDVNWKIGQPNSADGHCAFVNFSMKSANQSFVSMGDCAQKRKFICEVTTSLNILHVVKIKQIKFVAKNNHYFSLNCYLNIEKFGIIRWRP